MFDYRGLAEQVFQVTIRGQDEWMVKCIFHDGDSPSLQFNIKNGLYYCFNCEAKGNIKSLQKFLGRRISEAEVDVADVIAKLDLLDRQAGKSTKEVILPESLLKRYNFPTGYWKSRGFTDKTIKAFDLGYDPLENEAIIPVRNIKGELVGVIKRRLNDDNGIRYMYPKGFKRKTSMFAMWLLAKTDTDEVVITEGGVDAMTLWQLGIPAVAQYGSSISYEQVNLLRRLGINKITFFYDNDLAGKKALDIALPFTREFACKVVRYKKGDPKDPNGFDGTTLKQRVSSARSVL